MKTQSVLAAGVLTVLLFFLPIESISSDIHIVVRNKANQEKVKNALVTVYQYCEEKMSWSEKIYQFTDSDGCVTILDLEDWKKYIIKIEAKGFMTYLYKNRFYFQTPDVLEVGNYGLQLDLELIPLKSEVK